MCGIAGVAHTDADWPVDQGQLRVMCASIRHRGPDDDGYWAGDGAGLSMRRLSIIDVAGGHQPLANEDGQVQVVQNGEIYNFLAVKAELEAAGHRFITRSDTEVIAHAYEQWGEDFASHLIGMFAIAVWDRASRKLVLARDRFGEKPLFFYHDDRQLAFASELKALTQVAGVPRQIDILALDDYLALGYIPAPATIFAGIQQLPPAHQLVWQAGHCRIRPYWQLSFYPTCPDDEATAIATTRDLLREAVRKQLMSDVPLGAFLSGGIDSSAVVGMMAQIMNRPVETFSIGFEEAAYSEVAFARAVARKFGTNHHEFIVRPNLIDVLPSLVWTCDQPFADSSILPTYYVAKLAREYVTVALSGDGGDELFGGYARYAHALKHDAAPRLPAPVTALAASVSELLPDGFKGKARLRSLALPRDRRYVDTSSCFATSRKRFLYAPERYAAVREHDSYGAPLRRFATAHNLDFATQMQYTDAHVYLPDDILVKVDRASMAVSLETRAPLLDPILAEYVASLPSSYHIKPGRLKSLLKAAITGFVPDAVINRPKMGFGVPLKHWFRADLKAYARDVLGSQACRNRGLFDQGFVTGLLAHHEAGRADNSFRIWALLCFELWAQQYLDPATPTPLRHEPDMAALGIR
jgi:asparagine synthase (glutamine-hydrolysing)